MASKEALPVRERILQLTQGRVISKLNAQFWNVILSAKLSAAEWMDLIAPADLALIRTQNHINYEALVTLVVERIIGRISISDKVTLINSVRLLTTLIPPLYEQHGYTETIEARLFWNKDADGLLKDTLGFRLISSLVDYLFLPGFTVSEISSSSDTWEPGICRKYKKTEPQLTHEANRYEILRLILTLCSTSFYDDPKNLALSGSRFLSVLVSSLERKKVITLTASLLNVFLRTSRQPDENKLHYDNSLLTELRHLYTTNCANLLTTMLVYPLPRESHSELLHDPSNRKRPLNICRAFLAQYNDEQDMPLMATQLLSIIKGNMLLKDQSGHQISQPQPSTWINLALVLVWELIQCNAYFLASIINRTDELFVALLFNVLGLGSNETEKTQIQLSAHFLLYISSKIDLLLPLMLPIDPKLYESLPPNYKLARRPLTTRDFLVLQVCNKLTSSSPSISKSLLTCLTEILYNITTVVGKQGDWDTDDPAKRLGNYNQNGGLSYGSALLLCLVVSKFSEKTFLEQDPLHADILTLVLRAISTASVKYPIPSRMLTLSVLKNERLYENAWSTIYSLGNDEKDNEQIQDNEEDTSKLQGPVLLADTFNTDLFKTEAEEATFPFLDSFNRNPNSTKPLDEESVLQALRPKPLRGMSKQAREKQLMARPLHSTWTGNESLRIILTVIIPQLKLKLGDLWTKHDSNESRIQPISFNIIKQVELVEYNDLLLEGNFSSDYLPQTPLPMLLFSWNKLSLSWYITLIQGECYNSESNVRAHLRKHEKLSKSISMSLTSIGRFATGFSGWSKPVQAGDTEIESKYVADSLTTTNQWAGSRINTFEVEQPQSGGLFGVLAAKVGFGTSPQAIPGSPGGELNHALVRRISDLRLNNDRSNSITSGLSGLSTPQEEKEMVFPTLRSRNSVSSLHSLNSLNRSRSNTPRNSISC